MPMETTNSIRDDSFHVGSFEDWYEVRNDLPLLDIRNDHEYYGKGRHSVIGSIHIPLSHVKHRSYELPPRNNAFAVLVPATLQDRQEAIQLIREFFLCQTPLSNNDKKINVNRPRAPMPWKVPLVLLSEDDTNWKQAKELKCLEESLDDFSSTTSSSSFIFRPLPRLWQPDSMVKDILLPRLVELLSLSQPSVKNGHGSTVVNEIWDLGAGAGRDV